MSNRNSKNPKLKEHYKFTVNYYRKYLKKQKYYNTEKRF